MTAAEQPDTTNDVMRRLFTLRNATLLFIAFAAATTLVSAGLTTLLVRLLGRDAATSIGNAGQTYESVNAVFSGLAFVALVVTFRLQYEELRLQRHELENQRAAMDQSRRELHTSAEAKIRGLHVRLIEMSMEDKDLAAVWPQYQGKISATRSRQNKYINLIIQHQRMLFDIGRYDRRDVTAELRYLFTSPLVRDYWEGRMVARRVFEPPDRDQDSFDRLIDEVFLETVPPTMPPQPPRPPGPPLAVVDAGNDADAEGAEVIDLDAHRPTDLDVA